MKKITKILLSVFVLVLISASLIITGAAKENAISAFAVNTDSAENASDLGAVEWYMASDGNYYIFLPSSADRSNLTVWFTADEDVMCGETKLTDGEATDAFANGDSFTLTCGTASYEVKVLQASNSGTVYINTESGNMDAIHADKSHKEKGVIIILDENGNVQYDGKLSSIKGRGNSTWKQAKKPYNIKLDKKTDLFGMGKNKSWCLLASATEPSMIRNPLVYDFARNIGVETTGYSHYTNLYLNGEYAGLYILTEKVDIGENRIDIYDLEGATEDVNDKDLDEYKLAGKQNSKEWGTIKYADIPNNPSEITGGYLLELEKIHRYVDEASGFITRKGQAIVVKTPEYASKAQVEYISSYYQDFEDALYSATGYNSNGKHYSEYLDVDSLARMYVIQEFTAIFDGCSSSFFLWKDVDGKITAGPAWDYDGSLGYGQPNSLINNVSTTADPKLLFIQTCRIENHAKSTKALLAQAFTHKDFREKVKEIWAGEFSDYYPTFYSNIDAYKNEITDSFVMNAVRWNNFGTTNVEAIESKQDSLVKVIYDYVDIRYPFLSEVYSSYTCFVMYDVGNYGSALVNDTKIYKSGDKATVLDAPASTDSKMKFTGWTTNPDGSGDKYDEGDKITVKGNMKLFAQWSEKSMIEILFDSFVEFFRSIFESLAKLFK